MSVSVRYGLGAGLAMSAVFFLPSLVVTPGPGWLRYGEFVGYTTMILCMSATFFAMRQERERRGGRVSFGGAFAVGAGVTAVASVLFGLGTTLFYLTVGDALPELLYGHYVDQIRGSGLPAAEIEAQLAELAQMRWLLFDEPLQGLVMASTVFVIGIAESVIAALVVRRR